MPNKNSASQDHVFSGADDQETCMVPGEPENFTIDESQKQFWFFRCPGCHGVHGRQISQWWDDNSEEVAIHHCFICVPTGMHYRVDSEPPYKIILERRFRDPEPPTEIDDETINRLFE